MAMPAWIPEAFGRLSAENQKKAENIIKVLLQQLEGDAPAPKRTRLQYDILKGKIKIADNFDDPLPEFEEYM